VRTYKARWGATKRVPHARYTLGLRLTWDSGLMAHLIPRDRRRGAWSDRGGTSDDLGPALEIRPRTCGCKLGVTLGVCSYVVHDLY
jgi:hypothetical protein